MNRGQKKSRKCPFKCISRTGVIAGNKDLKTRGSAQVQRKSRRTNGKRVNYVNFTEENRTGAETEIFTMPRAQFRSFESVVFHRYELLNFLILHLTTKRLP